MRRLTLTLAIASLTLTACGTTPTERGVSGAGIGAGAGAVVGAVTGLSVAQGALIGAAAGGLTGALTRQDQINLGEPAWKQRQTAQAAPAPAPAPQPAQYAHANTDPYTVREIQSVLRQLGYYQGAVDGIAGPKTTGAIRSYQQQYGLAVDGRASSQLLNHMRQNGYSRTNA
ncbi:MAG: peptidoglycan-binding domain-containing protein [Chromatiales bacterium]